MHLQFALADRHTLAHRLVLTFESREFRQIAFDINQATDIGCTRAVTRALEFFDQRLILPPHALTGDVTAACAANLGQPVAHAGEFVGKFFFGSGGGVRIGDFHFTALHVEHGEFAFEFFDFRFGAQALGFVLSPDRYGGLGCQFRLLGGSLLIDGLLLDLRLLGVVITNRNQPGFQRPIQRRFL